MSSNVASENQSTYYFLKEQLAPFVAVPALPREIGEYADIKREAV